MNASLQSVDHPLRGKYRDGETLGAEITELCGYIYAATYQLLLKIREFDENEYWGVGGVCRDLHANRASSGSDSRSLPGCCPRYRGNIAPGTALQGQGMPVPGVYAYAIHRWASHQTLGRRWRNDGLGPCGGAPVSVPRTATPITNVMDKPLN